MIVYRSILGILRIPYFSGVSSPRRPRASTLPPFHDGRHHLVQRDGHERRRTVDNHLLVDLRVRLWHDEPREGVIRKAGRADRDQARGGGSAGPGVAAEVEQRLSGVAGLV